MPTKVLEKGEIREISSTNSDFDSSDFSRNDMSRRLSYSPNRLWKKQSDLSAKDEKDKKYKQKYLEMKAMNEKMHYMFFKELQAYRNMSSQKEVQPHSIHLKLFDETEVLEQNYREMLNIRLLD